MSAHSFLADKRDIEFVIFEHLCAENLFKIPYFSDHTRETFNEMQATALSMCNNKIGALNKVGDRVGCKHDPVTKAVTTPPGTKEAYKEFVENGFLTLTDDQAFNGLQAPSLFNITFMELFSGANQAFAMYPGLTRSASHVLAKHGNDFMKNICVAKISTGEWTGTMCLTEPSAGSAVGDLRSTAKRNGESFLIKGTKQWISGGEQDIAENIIHLVLARIEGAPQGIEGISLFVVPKKRFDKKTGALTGPNDMFCISLEEKMGIHGNSTCLLQFGDKDQCEGYLLGEENKGILYMFLMMNEARIGVGVQSLGQASVAFLNAEAYAKERIQGVDISAKGKADAKRLPIIEHPDVKRMLLRQRSIVEGMRALCYKAGKLFDESEHTDDKVQKKLSLGYLELLTPIVKAWSSDMGFESITDSLQVYGGYGFTREYPIEQILRDMKITSIYEGTNGIQALDFVGRKMRMNNGELFINWVSQCKEFVKTHSSLESIAGECAVLDKAWNQLLEAAGALQKKAESGDIQGAFLNAYPYMMAFGHATVANLLLEQAVVAHQKLQGAGVSPADQKFYRNKIRTAKFFVNNIVPENKGYLACVISADRTALDFEF